MTLPYSIRPAVIEDLDRVVELWSALMADQARYLRVARRTRRNRQIMAEHLAQLMQHRQVFVLEAEGNVMGFSAVVAPQPCLDTHFLSAAITDLYMEPKARKKGWGKALMEATIEAVRERGMHAVTLSVASGNPARALYRSLGFRPQQETLILPFDDSLVRFGPDIQEE